jgi:ABC-type polysaccharide/polyol phosphate export permease
MFRDLLYDVRVPPALDFLSLAAWAGVTVVVGWRVFSRLAPRFAEEL